MYGLSNKTEDSKKENITIKGHVGTWYVIDEDIYSGNKYYLLESEIYGEDAAGIITDADFNIILEDVYNGFEDLQEFFNN